MLMNKFLSMIRSRKTSMPANMLSRKPKFVSKNYTNRNTHPIWRLTWPYPTLTMGLKFFLTRLG